MWSYRRLVDLEVTIQSFDDLTWILALDKPN